jgi:hypothetical protein
LEAACFNMVCLSQGSVKPAAPKQNGPLQVQTGR